MIQLTDTEGLGAEVSAQQDRALQGLLHLNFWLGAYRWVLFVDVVFHHCMSWLLLCPVHHCIDWDSRRSSIMMLHLQSLIKDLLMACMPCVAMWGVGWRNSRLVTEHAPIGVALGARIPGPLAKVIAVTQRPNVGVALWAVLPAHRAWTKRGVMLSYASHW